ncbi:unnamed protein product [Ostreobium quekettii]|uniref:Uncharacterized protein n=1 Tax=Ostreobium quekettii TaxID=121088 RepID=A0A8S1ISN5_9CHLO|nr:unnamed protein product [Ostreobium quekettii]|eukprot:evm.model.scf_170.4 EVM.evm.TU.scf_170.4   scf_170:87950-94462(-)
MGWLAGLSVQRHPLLCSGILMAGSKAGWNIAQVALPAAHAAHGDALQGNGLEMAQMSIPKVAFMFLTLGPMANEPVWRAFFEAASRLTLKVQPSLRPPVNLTSLVGGEMKPPLQSVPDDLSNKPRLRRPHLLRADARDTQSKVDVEGWEGLVEDPEESESRRGVSSGVPRCGQEDLGLLDREVERLLQDRGDSVASQSLFSIYVNAPLGYRYPTGSLFRGRRIRNPADTSYSFAQFALVEAQLRMMAEALEDPLNEKFVMLSESAIPLYRPEIVYLQLVHESKSRVNACKLGKRMAGRWSPEMETAHLNVSHWRKTQFWTVLNRGHAELVMADGHVKEIFRRYCYSKRASAPRKGFVKFCVSDEHYIPTLLASYGLEDQTDCRGSSTRVQWSGDTYHPKTFHPKEVTPDLIRSIQCGWQLQCEWGPALQSSAALFEGVHSAGCLSGGSPMCDSAEAWDEASDGGEPSWVADHGYVALNYSCHLFARKFPPSAVNETLRAALSCDGGGLGFWC